MPYLCTPALRWSIPMALSDRPVSRARRCAPPFAQAYACSLPRSHWCTFRSVCRCPVWGSATGGIPGHHAFIWHCMELVPSGLCRWSQCQRRDYRRAVLRSMASRVRAPRGAPACDPCSRAARSSAPSAVSMPPASSARARCGASTTGTPSDCGRRTADSSRRCRGCNASPHGPEIRPAHAQLILAAIEQARQELSSGE